MARKLRLKFEGAIYHVTIRGVERRQIFHDDSDRERLLTRLGEAVEEYGVRLYLFAFMQNHIHLLCETPRANLSAFMHKLQTAYTVYFNLRHRRSGHLTQGRFGAEPVGGDGYLLKLSRYIHLNPVFVRGIRILPLKDKLRHLRSYRWSSHRGYAGLEEPYPFIDESPILRLTGAPGIEQRHAYRLFVEAGAVETDDELRSLLKTSRWGIGDEAFRTRVRDLHTERTLEVRRREDVSFRRVEPTVSAVSILKTVSKVFGIDPAFLRRRQYDCVARAVAASMLGRYAGMNQRDIGVFLGMGTGSAVCLQLKHLRKRQAQDAALRERIADIRTVTEAERQPNVP